MTPIELLLLAFALAMDAVAVSLALGLQLRRPRLRDALLAAGMFGFFQAAMPVLGWVLAFWFADAVSAAAPWIAFTLLLLIGLNMLHEAREDHDEGGHEGGTGESGSSMTSDRLTLRRTLPLAVATSIDAAAVGVTFGFLDVSVAPAVTVIGVVTFVLSLLAVVVGSRVGERLGSRAEVLGGVVLILIGLRILLDHLGVL